MLLLFNAIRQCSVRSQDVKTRFLKVSINKNFTYRSTTTKVAFASNLLHVRKTDKIVGGWLLSCAGMAFGAVILGGITRLTKSGLSMVDWHPLNEGRPKSEREWELEFQKYQQFPEFKITNKDMSLQNFKSIYWMEYIHRMWGRAIGVAFYGPAAAFWCMGYLSTSMKRRVLAMGLLLAGQGLMGWYMVKSGLEEKTGHDTTPRVSNLRLAAHLGTAFVLYSLLFRSGLQLILIPEQIKVSQSLKRFTMLGHIGKGLVMLTVLSGALVAGIEAGLVYNSFPKMADRWIPSDILSFKPMWSNFFENPTTVQFDHRLLGETVFCYMTALYLYSKRFPLPPRAKKAANAMLMLTWLQVGLGITTLLNYVPTFLAVAHQAGALTLFTTLLWLTHELKSGDKILKRARAMPK